MDIFVNDKISLSYNLLYVLTEKQEIQIVFQSNAVESTVKQITQSFNVHVFKCHFVMLNKGHDHLPFSH